METIDDETSDAAVDFIKRQARGRQAVLLLVQHHAHALAHARRSPSARSRPGRGRTEYADGMIEHDGHVGKMLKALDDAGDRRQHDRPLHDRQRPAHELLAGRRDDAVPQREEHQLGGRVPRAVLIRWPGKIKPGTVSNEIVSGHDWLPTLLAAAGEPDIKEKLLKGHEAGKQDVQGPSRRLQPAALSDRASRSKSPRRGFFYFNDDGDLVALRFENWKVVFMEQRAQGTLRDLGRAVHAAARAQALRPAHRPVRAGRHHVEHLLRLARLDHPTHLPGPGRDGEVPG